MTSPKGSLCQYLLYDRRLCLWMTRPVPHGRLIVQDPLRGCVAAARSMRGLRSAAAAPIWCC